MATNLGEPPCRLAPTDRPLIRGRDLLLGLGQRPRAGWGQAELGSRCGSLSAAAHVEFAQHRGDVVMDGLFGHDEVLRNLGVAESLGEEPQHFEFAWC